MTPLRTVRIRRAHLREAHRVTTVIADAFQSLHVSAWLVPDLHSRRQVLYANFRIHVEHAFAQGHVDVTEDHAGVAVWFPRDKPLPAIDDYHQRLSLACWPYEHQFHVFDSVLDRHHPPEAHHHLAFLAVKPLHQSTGIGSALLRHYHRRLDPDHMPAYLEAANTESRALYLRHGYHDHGQPITLPNGPTMWPMWRHPHTE